MAKVTVAGSRTGKGAMAKAEPDDNALLLAIARDRDRAAFEQLFLRYSSAALSLARHLTGGTDAAEEAIQAAMLKIWLYAGSYRPGGNARAWILRIVARACLQGLRGRAREERIRARAEEGAGAAGGVAPRFEAGLERGEILSGLRTCLEALPVRQRRLLALCYGAEMSHREIAEALALPERTVTYQVHEALRHLRGDLTRAGFAAALPYLDAECLGEALCSGCEGRPGLFQTVFERLEGTGQGALRTVCGCSVAAKAGAGGYLALLVLAAVAVLRVLFATLQEAPGAAPAGKRVLDSAPAPGEPVGTGRQGKIHRRWTFEKGPAADLRVLRGDWRWIPGQGGRSPGMAADSAEVYVLLPLDFPSGRCLEVTIRGTSLPSAQEGFMMCGRHGTQEIYLQHDIWGTRLLLTPYAQLTARTYLMERWEVDTFWNAAARFLGANVCRYHEGATSNSNVLIALKGIAVQEFLVSEITKEEVPKRFQNPARVIEELRLNPKIPANIVFP